MPDDDQIRQRDPSTVTADPFGSSGSPRWEQVLGPLDRWRDRPAATAGMAVLAVAVAVAGWWLGRPSGPRPVEDSIPFATTVVAAPSGMPPPGASPAGVSPAGVSPDAAASAEPRDLLVHVAGAVFRPGVVTLQSGDRVLDAVTAAGGPTPEADVHQLNLAAPVVDGLQITVPVMGERAPSPTGVAPGPAGPTEIGPGAPLNVNLAGEDELDRLPGIGPSLAAAIVEWRNQHGPFASVDALRDVPGIGPAKLAALVDHVTV